MSKKLKDNIKKCIPSILYSSIKEYRYINQIFEFRKIIRDLSKIKRDYKYPKIVFVLQFPETWNSLKSVYESAMEHNDEVIVLCIHKPLNSTWNNNQKCETRENEAYNFCKQNNINAINAFNEKTHSWFDLQSFEPDYVFYTRPYNNHLPKQYHNNVVCTYAKVCHIPYGADMGSILMDPITINDDFIKSTYLEFTHSKKNEIYFKKRFALRKLLDVNKCVYLGFPRFDLVNTSSEKSNKTTILWLPRWCVSNSDVNNYDSHFFSYIENFIDFMSNNQDINLIIRPHPLMFNEIIRKNILSKQELEELINRITNCKNIKLDENKDYLDAFSKSDILIADFSSLVIEFFVTGKPIIYCEEKPVGVHKDYEQMYKSFYLTSNWDKIKTYIEKLRTGDDVKYQDRQQVLKYLDIQTDGKIGERIYNYVLNDFNGKNIEEDNNE